MNERTKKIAEKVMADPYRRASMTVELDPGMVWLNGMGILMRRKQRPFSRLGQAYQFTEVDVWIDKPENLGPCGCESPMIHLTARTDVNGGVQQAQYMRLLSFVWRCAEYGAWVDCHEDKFEEQV